MPIPETAISMERRRCPGPDYARLWPEVNCGCHAESPLQLGHALHSQVELRMTSCRTGQGKNFDDPRPLWIPETIVHARPRGSGKDV